MNEEIAIIHFVCVAAGGNGSRWQKLRQNEIQKILTTWCDSIDA
jgi:hypothetical protein